MNSMENKECALKYTKQGSVHKNLGVEGWKAGRTEKRFYNSGPFHFKIRAGFMVYVEDTMAFEMEAGKGEQEKINSAKR